VIACQDCNFRCPNYASVDLKYDKHKRAICPMCGGTDLRQIN